MKILLQDGSTVLENVAKVEEQISINEEGQTTQLLIQIDKIGGMTGDKIVEYYHTIGMDKLTAFSNSGATVHEYVGFPKLTTVYITRTDDAEYINMTLV